MSATGMLATGGSQGVAGGHHVCSYTYAIHIRCRSEGIARGHTGLLMHMRHPGLMAALFAADLRHSQ
eukprot:scaffold108060_cov12-Tisochrysis_lutea.AAC.1